MSEKILKPRQRNTKATARRLANMRVLIDMLGKCNLEINDIAKLFGMAMSGARKYARELADAGVIVDIGDYGTSRFGRKLYGINPDPALTEQYLKRIDNPAPLTPAAPRIATLEPGRLVHTILDDEFEPRRQKRVRPVAPDPMALPQGFFGVKGSAT